MCSFGGVNVPIWHEYYKRRYLYIINERYANQMNRSVNPSRDNCGFSVLLYAFGSVAGCLLQFDRPILMYVLGVLQINDKSLASELWTGRQIDRQCVPTLNERKWCSRVCQKIFIAGQRWASVSSMVEVSSFSVVVFRPNISQKIAVRINLHID